MAGKKNDKGGASKDKGKEEKGGKAKGAQSINVRHILVSSQKLLVLQDGLTRRKCEKHAKKEEALAKLRDGVKFDEVAREFSEDKARQGTERLCGF